MRETFRTLDIGKMKEVNKKYRLDKEKAVAFA